MALEQHETVQVHFTELCPFWSRVVHVQAVLLEPLEYAVVKDLLTGEAFEIQLARCACVLACRLTVSAFIKQASGHHHHIKPPAL